MPETAALLHPPLGAETAPLLTIRPSVRRGGVTSPSGLGARAGRRAYNRRYMQRWRARNEGSVPIDNGDRSERLRRKRRREARVKGAARPRKCVYGCRRPAVTTIERIDPGTWQTILVPYCGFC